MQSTSQQEKQSQVQAAADDHRKNIVICCDGTGNQFGDCNSNVVKLYTALKIDNHQAGYYHPGVGTMGDPGARGKLSSLWSTIKGLAFGAGFRANVLDAYRYLMDTYNDGDCVYLFGFSRGAYTARALAGLLDGYGLLCKGNEGHIPYAWRLYMAQLKDRNRQSIDGGEASAAAFKETFSHPDFRIHFVGLWDTVSSVGWVSAPLRLFNVAQNRTVDKIRHAVSIDERRCFYQDNLYGDALPAQDGVPEQDLQQVWFAGVHSDVGGSYTQATSGLSNITLEWMIGEAKKFGATFVPDRIELVLGRPASTHPASQRLFRTPAAEHVHISLKGPWWLLEILPHRYYDKDDGQEQHRIPLGTRRELPCGALVHHSVYDRMKNLTANYRPKNLQKEELSPLSTPLCGLAPVLYTYRPSGNLKDGTFKRRSLLVLFSGAEAALALAVLGVPLFLAGRSVVNRYSAAHASAFRTHPISRTPKPALADSAVPANTLDEPTR